MSTAADRKLVTGLISIADDLSERLAEIDFSSVTRWVYNPLVYAREAYHQYLKKYAHMQTENVFMGMNPGPWGMAQTGVPFGEVAIVKEWLQIKANVGKPELEHPKRPILGFDCSRSEVSGRRLWSFFREHYGDPNNFFAHNFILNYCPLVFMDESSRNLTPDKMPRPLRNQIHEACDQHLKESLRLLKPKILVGIGNYAYECLGRVSQADPELQGCEVIKILHPSPASPASNRGWSQSVESALSGAGILPVG